MDTKLNKDPAFKAKIKDKRLKVVFDTWFGKTFLYRISAFLVWYFIFIRIFDKNLPFNINNYYQKYLLIPALFSFILLIISWRIDRFLFYPIYIGFFPFALIWIIPKTIYRGIKFRKILKSWKFTAMLIFIIIVGWIIIFKINNLEISTYISLVTHSACYLLFLNSFNFASNPYKPIENFVKFFGGKASDFLDKIITKPITNPDSQINKQLLNSAVTFYDFIINFIDKLSILENSSSEGLPGFTRKWFVSIFISIFLFLYGLLGISFSISLFWIERAWGTQINGLSSSGEFIDYIYFNFLSLLTAIPNNIQPITVFGKLWIVWIIISGVLLLTILLTMFTTTASMQSDSFINDTVVELKQIRDKYLGWKTSLEEKQNLIEGEIKVDD